MTRTLRSAREIDRAIEKLSDRTPDWQRPEPLTAEEKRLLDEAFSVDPEGIYASTRADDPLAMLHEEGSA